MRRSRIMERKNKHNKIKKLGFRLLVCTAIILLVVYTITNQFQRPQEDETFLVESQTEVTMQSEIQDSVSSNSGGDVIEMSNNQNQLLQESSHTDDDNNDNINNDDDRGLDVGDDHTNNADTVDDDYNDEDDYSDDVYDDKHSGRNDDNDEDNLNNNDMNENLDDIVTDEEEPTIKDDEIDANNVDDDVYNTDTNENLDDIVTDEALPNYDVKKYDYDEDDNDDTDDDGDKDFDFFAWFHSYFKDDNEGENDNANDVDDDESFNYDDEISDEFDDQRSNETNNGTTAISNDMIDANNNDSIDLLHQMDNLTLGGDDIMDNRYTNQEIEYNENNTDNDTNVYNYGEDAIIDNEDIIDDNSDNNWNATVAADVDYSNDGGVGDDSSNTSATTTDGNYGDKDDEVNEQENNDKVKDIDDDTNSNDDVDDDDGEDGGVYDGNDNFENEDKAETTEDDDNNEEQQMNNDEYEDANNDHVEDNEEDEESEAEEVDAAIHSEFGNEEETSYDDGDDNVDETNVSDLLGSEIEANNGLDNIEETFNDESSIRTSTPNVILENDCAIVSNLSPMDSTEEALYKTKFSSFSSVTRTTGDTDEDYDDDNDDDDEIDINNNSIVKSFEEVTKPVIETNSWVGNEMKDVTHYETETGLNLTDEVINASEVITQGDAIVQHINTSPKPIYQMITPNSPTNIDKNVINETIKSENSNNNVFPVASLSAENLMMSSLLKSLLLASKPSQTNDNQASLELPNDMNERILLLLKSLNAKPVGSDSAIAPAISSSTENNDSINTSESHQVIAKIDGSANSSNNATNHSLLDTNNNEIHLFVNSSIGGFSTTSSDTDNNMSMSSVKSDDSKPINEAEDHSLQSNSTLNDTMQALTLSYTQDQATNTNNVTDNDSIVANYFNESIAYNINANKTTHPSISEITFTANSTHEIDNNGYSEEINSTNIYAGTAPIQTYPGESKGPKYQTPVDRGNVPPVTSIDSINFGNKIDTVDSEASLSKESMVDNAMGSDILNIRKREVDDREFMRTFRRKVLLKDYENYDVDQRIKDDYDDRDYGRGPLEEVEGLEEMESEDDDEDSDLIDDTNSEYDRQRMGIIFPDFEAYLAGRRSMKDNRNDVSSFNVDNDQVDLQNEYRDDDYGSRELDIEALSLSLEISIDDLEDAIPAPPIVSTIKDQEHTQASLLYPSYTNSNSQLPKPDNVAYLRDFALKSHEFNDNNINTGESKQSCLKPTDIAANRHPVTALVSFPGEVTKWMRNVLELLSGEPSDSIYRILAKIDSGDVKPLMEMQHRVAIETHSNASRWFDRAIVLLRNPFAVEKGQIRFRPFSIDWQYDFLWAPSTVSWLESNIPVLVLTFEDMVENLQDHLSMISLFLEINSSNENWDCALQETSPSLITKSKMITGRYSKDRRRIRNNIDMVMEAAITKCPHILSRLFMYKSTMDVP